MPKCTDGSVGFGRVGRRVVEAAFDGGDIVIGVPKNPSLQWFSALAEQALTFVVTSLSGRSH